MYISGSIPQLENEFPIQQFHRVLESFSHHGQIDYSDLLNAIDVDHNCAIDLAEAHAFTAYYYAAFYPQHPTEPDIDIDQMLKVQLQVDDMSKFNAIKDLVNKYSDKVNTTQAHEDKITLNNFNQSFEPSLKEALFKDRSKLNEVELSGLCL